MLNGYLDFYELTPRQLSQAVHQAADIQAHPGNYVYKVQAGDLTGIYQATGVEAGGKIYNMLAFALEDVGNHDR